MPVERVVSLLIAVACLALGVWVSVLTTQRDFARQDAAAWQESAEKNRAALEAMTAAQAQLEKALGEREQDLVEVKQQRERQRVHLREAMRHDQEVDDWGSPVLPSSVDRLLR